MGAGATWDSLERDLWLAGVVWGCGEEVQRCLYKKPYI